MTTYAKHPCHSSEQARYDGCPVSSTERSICGPNFVEVDLTRERVGLGASTSSPADQSVLSGLRCIAAPLTSLPASGESVLGKLCSSRTAG